MAISLSSLLVASMLAGLGAGGGPPLPKPHAINDLILTEVRDGTAGQRFIEIQNHAGSNLNPSGYLLIIDGAAQDLGGIGNIQNQQYRTIGDSGTDDLALALTLGAEGAVIQIQDPFGGIIDWIEYGTAGDAPDPIDGASLSRFYNATDYEEDWSLDLTPTRRAQNDGPDVDALPLLVLNEVLYDSAVSPSDRFIELRYSGWTTLNVNGHRVQGDALYTITENVILSPSRRHFVLQNDDAPGLQALFDSLSVAADNVYLYSPGGERMDMVGWSSAHLPDTSVCRVVGGRGGHGGFSDLSSIIDGWQFGCSATPLLIEIGPDQVGYSDPGNVVTYRLNVTNGQPVPTTVDLSVSAPPNGWGASLFAADGLSPLPDSNGNGFPDVSLAVRGAAGDLVAITLVVTIPATAPPEDFLRSRIDGLGSPGGAGLATVTTNLNPLLSLDRWADPTTIYIAGSGFQEETTLTLEVVGRGVPIAAESAEFVDVVFIMDDTGSMSGAIEALKADITEVTDRLAENVSSLRLGLVSFKDVPPWGPYEIDIDIDLTFDIDAFKAAVNALFASGGGDGPEDGDVAMEVAANLSWRTGNVTRGIVHITDAETHDNLHLTTVARWAWQVRGIHTNTVAVGGIWVVPPTDIICLVDPNVAYWLNRTAENGTGSFDIWYPQPPPPWPSICPGTDLGDMILTGLIQLIPAIDTAASDPDPTDPDPMVRDVLPPYIGVVPGTFRDPGTGAPRPPDYMTNDASGNTILEWNITEIKVGDTWRVSFDVRSTLAGLVPTNVYGLSRASYHDWDGRPATVLFPEVNVTVLIPAYLPPRNVTTHWDGASTIWLTWEEPKTPVHHYLIYKVGGDPRGFSDLSVGAAYASVPAPATSWTDPAPLTGAGEHYYLMRSSDLSGGNVSETTNTAGVFAVDLTAGRAALSRPLEYFPWVDYTGSEVDSLAEHAAVFGAVSADHMDATGTWRSVPGTPDVRVDLGRAFVLDIGSPGGLAVFTGLPGAMVRYDDGAFAGYDLTAARSLTASVAGDDIVLTFGGVTGLSGGSYEVWASRTRTGFHDGTAMLLSAATPATFPATAVHAGALAAGAEWYYWVVPVHPLLGPGASTFSVGVWSRTYLEKDTFALPLRAAMVGAISSYADAVPGALGLLRLLPGGAWIPHFTEMTAGTYDVAIPLATGFQIDLRSPVRFVHVGW